MPGEPKNRAEQAFKLKGTMPALTMFQLLSADLEAIEAQLVEHIARMPQFFQNAPVMIDLHELGDTPFDFEGLAAMLRRRALVPVAVRNPTDAQRERAVAAHWGVLQTMLTRPERTTAPAAEPASRPAAAAGSEPATNVTVTVRQPVRSGQVVHVPTGDLIVLSPVSSGAELVADGNIHVYAPLRGRAMAGVHDNRDASIYCMCLEAELVAIAGLHLTSEDIPEERWSRPARVHVQGERLVVSAL